MGLTPTLSVREAEAILADDNLYPYAPANYDVANPDCQEVDDKRCIYIVHPTNVVVLAGKRDATMFIENKILFQHHPIVSDLIMDTGAEKGLFLAGGAVASALCGLKFMSGDIDLFPVGMTTAEVKDKLNTIAGHLGPTWTVERTTRRITFVKKNLKIRVILRSYKTKLEVLKSFDLGSSAVGYTRNSNGTSSYEFWFTGEARVAYIHSVNIVNLKKRSPNFEYRLAKYYKRGFGLALFDIPAPINIRYDGCLGSIKFHNLEIHDIDSFADQRIYASVDTDSELGYESGPLDDFEMFKAAYERDQWKLTAKADCATGIDVTAINPTISVVDAGVCAKRYLNNPKKATIEMLYIFLNQAGREEYVKRDVDIYWGFPDAVKATFEERAQIPFELETGPIMVPSPMTPAAWYKTE